MTKRIWSLLLGAGCLRVSIIHLMRSSVLGYWLDGWRDLVGGARKWRVSYLLGYGEIRRRYSRSRLGQFWVTLTTGMTIIALGFVWSQLWRSPVTELMPFVAVSMITWGFVSGVLGDAPNTFVSAAPIMHNQGIESSALLYALIFKHLLILAHNLPIIVITMAIFGVWPGMAGFGALAGLVLLVLFLFGVSSLVAIACLRFRDLTQIVQNGVTMLFFITPILWKPSQIPENRAYLLDFNPFALYLSMIQKPLLGGWPSMFEWITAIGLSLFALAFATLAIGWGQRRLIYWL